MHAMRMVVARHATIANTFGVHAVVAQQSAHVSLTMSLATPSIHGLSRLDVCMPLTQTYGRMQGRPASGCRALTGGVR